MKLPNAPLLEVIFELRWALEGAENLPVQLRQDPAYPLLAYEFTEKAKLHGFVHRREIEGFPTGPLGHKVHYRYNENENAPFPIWQIGPGVFAYNESTEYEWKSYRVALRRALRSFLLPQNWSFQWFLSGRKGATKVDTLLKGLVAHLAIGCWVTPRRSG